MPAFGRGNFLYGIFLPKSAGVAKGLETALGTDAGTGEDNKFLHSNRGAKQAPGVKVFIGVDDDNGMKMRLSYGEVSKNQR